MIMQTIALLVAGTVFLAAWFGIKHFNLSKNVAFTDRLSNIAIGWFYVGQALIIAGIVRPFL